jgi:hypothetical protein
MAVSGRMRVTGHDKRVVCEGQDERAALDKLREGNVARMKDILWEDERGSTGQVERQHWTGGAGSTGQDGRAVLGGMEGTVLAWMRGYYVSGRGQYRA